MTYNFYKDPGHGWLQVSKQELYELGIADKITRYSYEELNTAYLEEDCDFGTFIKAKGWTKRSDADIKIIHQDETFIRKLSRYGA